MEGGGGEREEKGREVLETYTNMQTCTCVSAYTHTHYYAFTHTHTYYCVPIIMYCIL